MITFVDVEEARERIQSQIYLSPFPYSETISRLTETRIFFKLENLQITGSFKERGALNRLLTLTPDEAQRGVIAASAGNHGMAVAFHSQRLKIAATIVMPLHQGLDGLWAPPVPDPVDPAVPVGEGEAPVEAAVPTAGFAGRPAPAPTALADRAEDVTGAPAAPCAASSAGAAAPPPAPPEAGPDVAPDPPVAGGGDASGEPRPAGSFEARREMATPLAIRTTRADAAASPTYAPRRCCSRAPGAPAGRWGHRQERHGDGRPAGLPVLRDRDRLLARVRSRLAGTVW